MDARLLFWLVALLLALTAPCPAAAQEVSADVQAEIDAHPLEGPAVATLTGASLVMASPILFIVALMNICVGTFGGGCGDESGWEALAVGSAIGFAAGLGMRIGGAIWWADNDLTRRRLSRQAGLEVRPLVVATPELGLLGLDGRF